MAFEEMMNDPAIGGGPPQGPPQGPQMGGPPQGPQMGGPPQGMLQPGGPPPEAVLEMMTVLKNQAEQINGLRGEVNPLTQSGLMPPMGQLAGMSLPAPPSLPPMGGMPPMGPQGPPMPPMGGPPMPPMGPIA